MRGVKDFIIYPFGEVGIHVKNILRDVYNLEPKLVMDSHLCKYNDGIKPLSYLASVPAANYALFLASTNQDIYKSLKEHVLEYVDEDFIIELDCMKNLPKNEAVFWKTEIGRYSYGPIVRDHELIASIGNFCSFASGVDVVPNHPVTYITTHPFLYAGQVYEELQID